MAVATMSPPIPRRLLLTGVDNPIGGNLALALAGRFEVVGLCHRVLVHLDGCRTERWEPNDSAALGRWLELQSPSWVVHCGPLGCGSWDLPVETPDAKAQARVCDRLACWASESGGRLTALFSDAVFGGPALFHREDEPPALRDPFARAVRKCEQALAGIDALIVRTHAFGWSPLASQAGLAQRICESLLGGPRVALCGQRHATPILATHLAELLVEAYHRGLKGPLHVAGAERTSMLRFGQEMAAALGLRAALGACEDSGKGRRRRAESGETSLDTRQARRDLGRPMPLVREGLDLFALQARNGYRSRLRQAPRAA